MYIPKFSTKRVLGLTLAAALAVGATVAVAGSSQATTTVTALKLSPATGPSGAGSQVVSVTGKGFMSGTTSQVGVVEFDSSACGSASGAAGSVAVTSSTSVLTATRLTLTATGLALSTTPTTWYLCVFSNAGTPLLLGSSKYNVYPAPTITSISTPSGSDLGGTSVDFVGTNFTKNTKVTFDGIAATKVTFTSATAVTAVTPVHASSATAVDIVLSTEGGPVTDAAAFTYKNAIKISPATGTATALHSIDVLGQGFTPTSAVFVTLAQGTLAAATVKTSCANIQIVSTTELTCDVPNTIVAGPYTVFVSTTAAGGAFVTVNSSGATYTASPF